MRWPFHFGKSPDRGTVQAPEPAARRRDWESLPPIQRAVGEPELTAPTMEFVESLAGSQDPGTSLETLGHNVSIEAPHGLVSGIATTAGSYSPSIEMVGRPRRGRQAPTAQRRVDDSAEVPELADIAEPEDAATAPTPVRELQPVEAPAPSPRPLTRLAEPDRATLSLTSVQRAQAPAPGSAPARSQPAERSPSAEPSSPPATTESGVPLPGRPPVAQRLTLGQSRRLGLGPPLAAGNVPVLQRSTAITPPEAAPSPRPLARPKPAVESRSEPAQDQESDPLAAVSETVPSPDLSPAVQSLSEARTPAPLAGLAMLPVAARQSTSPIPLPPPAVQRAAAGDVPATQKPRSTQPEPLTAPPPSITVPLVSNRPPLPGGRSAISAPEAASAPFEFVDSAPIAQLMPVAPGALESIPAPSDRTQPALPRNAEPARTLIAAPAPEPPPLLMRPPVQRAMTAPQEASAEPAHARFEPAFFAVSTLAGGAQQVQVQRQPAAAEVPMTAPAAAEAPAGTAPAPTAGAAPAHESEKDLDELARKLHDRISARIRYDLLVDRERAGMLTDLR